MKRHVNLDQTITWIAYETIQERNKKCVLY